MKRPLLHFFVLGGLLWWVKLVAPSTPMSQSVLSVPETRVAALRSQLTRRLGTPPSAAELNREIEAWIDEEILFREALAAKLHETDPLVRRRLVRNLRFVAEAPELSDDELLADALALGLHQSDLVVRRRLVQKLQLLTYAAARREPGDAELESYWARHSDRWRGHSLDSVRNQVRYAWLDERGDRALRELLLRLRVRYPLQRDAG